MGFAGSLSAAKFVRSARKRAVAKVGGKACVDGIWGKYGGNGGCIQTAVSQRKQQPIKSLRTPLYPLYKHGNFVPMPNGRFPTPITHPVRAASAR